MTLVHALRRLSTLAGPRYLVAVTAVVCALSLGALVPDARADGYGLIINSQRDSLVRCSGWYSDGGTWQKACAYARFNMEVWVSDVAGYYYWDGHCARLYKYATRLHNDPWGYTYPWKTYTVTQPYCAVPGA